MARKKTSKSSGQKRNFSNGPFTSLKGLSASEPREPAAARAVSVAGEDSLSADERPQSFVDAMAALGVEPLNGAGTEESPAQKHSLPETPGQPEPPGDDRALFLDALGSLDTVFQDEWPQDRETPRAVPRRLRQVERGRLKPQAELDLHGLSVDEARPKVRIFMQNAVRQRFAAVLIITGRGLHSSDGPVLRDAVEALLAQSGELVVEWGRAPQRYGGNGALVVFPRC
jgi:DNA-nicking Smr family endonuclease